MNIVVEEIWRYSLNWCMVGGKHYVYIGTPLEAFSCISFGDDYPVWCGATNMQYPAEAYLSNPRRRCRFPDFKNVQEAFHNVRGWQKTGSRFLGGFVKDFAAGVLYYDQDKILEYVERKFPEEYAFLEKIKVEQWEQVP